MLQGIKVAYQGMLEGRNSKGRPAVLVIENIKTQVDFLRRSAVKVKPESPGGDLLWTLQRLNLKRRRRQVSRTKHFNHAIRGQLMVDVKVKLLSLLYDWLSSLFCLF